MRRLPAAALVCALLIAACGQSGQKETTSAQTTSAQPAPKPPPASVPVRKGDEKVIRAWNKAENAGDYKKAASYFAKNAIVIQSFILQLINSHLAEEWNSGLPCRADITFIRGEQATTLVGFDLREGPTHKCKEGGSAQVRFTIRGGLIRQWRQLPVAQQAPAPAI
jgi:hypothetical protein